MVIGWYTAYHTAYVVCRTVKLIGICMNSTEGYYSQQILINLCNMSCELTSLWFSIGCHSTEEVRDNQFAKNFSSGFPAWIQIFCIKYKSLNNYANASINQQWEPIMYACEKCILHVQMGYVQITKQQERNGEQIQVQIRLVLLFRPEILVGIKDDQPVKRFTLGSCA